MQNSAFKEAVLAQMVLPYQANPAGNVHGGEIMKMMDSTAGVAAQKYCRTNVVTARVDELQFRKPICVGSLVTCKGQVIYTGNSSMEVFVTVESENLQKKSSPEIALTAFFTMVSLDDNGLPLKVEPLNIENATPYEMKLYKEGEKRYTARKTRIKKTR